MHVPRIRSRAVLQGGIEHYRMGLPLKPANVAAVGRVSRRASDDRRDAGCRMTTVRAAAAAADDDVGSVEVLASLNRRIARGLNVEEINNWLRQQNVQNFSLSMVFQDKIVSFFYCPCDFDGASIHNTQYACFSFFAHFVKATGIENDLYKFRGHFIFMRRVKAANEEFGNQVSDSLTAPFLLACLKLCHEDDLVDKQSRGLSEYLPSRGSRLPDKSDSRYMKPLIDEQYIQIHMHQQNPVYI